MSINRENVYKIIKIELDKTGLDLYQGKAPQNAKFLHGEFSIRTSAETDVDSDDDINLRLHVDLWDNKTDTAELERAAKSVLDQLSFRLLEDDSVSVWVEREGINELPDPDEFVRRIKVTFILRTRFKE